MSSFSISDDFFTAGGTLPPTAPSYVIRPSDDELFRHIMAGEFCNVLTSRQMGKSSLMIRTSQRLKEEGVNTVIVDLTGIGTSENSDFWYKGVLIQIRKRLDLSIDVISWWDQKEGIPVFQKFISFFEEVLNHIEGRIVIFVDEIDTTIKLDFRDDFFAGIRSIYNLRADQPEYQRLTFVLLGVASPSDLIKERTRTPYNIGEEILLKNFRRQDAQILVEGLEQIYPGIGGEILDHIFYWTDGHPYLTQKLCSEIAGRQKETWDNQNIDKLVNDLFLSEQARRETNLKYVQDRVLDSPNRVRLLSTYNKVLKGGVREDGQSLIQTELKLSGLILPENGILRVRNQIYRTVFSSQWIKQNTPRNWYRVGAIGFVSIVIMLFALSAYVLINDFLIGTKINDSQVVFYSATTTSERLSSLANIIRSKGILQNTDSLFQARELFFTLNRDDQLSLFSDPSIQDSTNLYPDLATVIKGLYVTFADLDGSGDSNDLLSAMYNSLEKVNTEEGINLRKEIGFWLKARGVIKDDLNSGQLENYTQAITLNGENPATRYERAHILMSSKESYDMALVDLNIVTSIAKESFQEGEAPEKTPALSDATATFTPESPFTPIAAITEISTDATITPSSPLSPATVGTSGYKSNFYTYIGITNAVRLLLLDNRPLQIAFYADPDRYTSLRDNRLVPPISTATVTTPGLLIPTETTIFTPFETPTITPTWDIVITIPPEIYVGAWHDNSPNCGSSIISINGVEILGSTPPYKITFWQYDRIIASKVIDSPVGAKLEFTDPVTVDKGHSVHVTISFYKAGQKYTWTGDLYYFDDPGCSLK